MITLLSTIILNLTLSLGFPPSPAQVNAVVAADHQAGIIVVTDTVYMN